MHFDLDAFFCAVEEQRDPSLKGVAFAVGGRPDQRGVVASCSYAARKHGVKSAMPMARALRLCPDLKIITSRHHAYSKVSTEVMKRLKEVTPLVEQVSIDEAFLDVSEDPRPAEDVALDIQRTIHEELDLPCSLGVATNKLLAKTANDYGKARAIAEMVSNESQLSTKNSNVNRTPSAITVVPPGEEANFLGRLPVRALWGVGPKTAASLAQLGIKTIGELANYSETKLVQLFGKNGQDLALRAKGIDDRPIITVHKPKSISQERTFARDVSDGEKLRAVIYEMSKKISTRLTTSGFFGSTVKIKIRWPDFSTITRQTTLSSPSDNDELIYSAAKELFEKEWIPGMPVRLVGVGVSSLGPHHGQLNFWQDLHSDIHSDNCKSDKKSRTDQLNEVVEILRRRYGKDILYRASELKVEKK